MRRSIGFGVVTLGAIVLASACGGQGEPAGEMKTVTQSIDPGKAQSVAVTLEMNAGELKVEGGAAKLMDATFRFNVPSWEPKIDYADGDRGTLHVTQAGSSNSFGNSTNDWNVRLSDTVPMAVSASIGAGEATLNLGAMNLQRVEVKQ